jgi:hypothetical protein
MSTSIVERGEERAQRGIKEKSFIQELLCRD